MKTLKISHKFFVAVAVPVVFELVLIAILFVLLWQADEARLREQQGRELANTTYKLMSLHVQRVTQIMIYKSTDEPAMLAQARQTAQRMKEQIEQIHLLVQSNPKSSETWKGLDALVRQIGAEHDRAAECMKVGDKAGATVLYMSMRKHFEQLILATDKLTAQQAESKDVEGIDVSKYSELIRIVLGFSVLLSLLIAFGLAFYFRRGTADRLNVIMANTKMMAAGKAPAEKLDGDDELAQIDHLYHKMHDALVILRRRERAILENVADVVCSVDSSMRFTDINEAVSKHWGYSEEDLIGGRLADLVVAADRDMVLLSLRKVIETTKETSFECGVTRADGTVADTEWTVAWSEVEGSLYCVMHDITARKNLDRMKAEFVSMVSHEIRTPLSSIQMTHSLLAQELGDSLDDFMKDSLHAAQGNVNRLMALVNNLLDLDKLESGFIDFIAEPISLGDLVEMSIGAIASLFQQKSITVQRELDPALMIYADKERLVQVLINLLANAIKYSPPKSKILVEALLDRDFVRIAITDTGRGIPANKLNTVFERFGQVEAADQKVHKGTGLGLAIAKAIVEMHKGEMGVESVEGKGSTFWFTVPASEQAFKAIGASKVKST
ncbi:MAG: PAS domain-containing sensor histidine kinase [Candidatus Obscuribacterales bacterium]